ncbi:MAG: MFS transporter [Candidatus Sericytochromatia bacterium]|nr:MFS transporter [Candidatus Sericytochromatia bacterium]
MMKKYALITIFITVFLDIFGFGIIIPLLPFYAQKFGANPLIIGLLMSSNSVAQFIFNPIWGRISDRYGRRPVMICTVFGSFLAYLLFGLSNSIWLLFLSRILAGVTGATIGVAQSYIADLTTNKNRSKALGQLGAAFALGFVFGPALSGILANPKIYLLITKYVIDVSYLAQYSYGMPGFIAAGLSFINLVMVFLFLPESSNIDKKLGKKAFDVEGFKKVIKHPEMRMLMIILCISMFSTSNMFSTFALFLQTKFKYGVSQSSFLFAYFGICTAVVQGLLVGRLVKRFNEIKLLCASTVALTIGMFMMPYMPNIFCVLIASTVIFLGNGIMTPCLTSLITQRAQESQIGVTLGVSQSLGSLARIVGPLWGGYIFYVGGYPYPYLTGGIFAIFAFFCSIKLVEMTDKFKNNDSLVQN